MRRSGSSESPQWPNQRALSRSISSNSTRRTSHPGSTHQLRDDRLDDHGEIDDEHPEAIHLPEISTSDGRKGSRKYKPVAADDKPTSSNMGPRKSNSAATTILTDCMAVILPLAILVFVIMVWRLHNSPVEESSLNKWENAINIFATLFPILFASIIGRLMSESARWKLENGATMGALEQLMGSRTVGSTVSTLFQLRAINILGIGLLIVWAFSPLGAQALLRTLTSRLGTNFESTSVIYFDNRSPSWYATMRFRQELNVGPVGPAFASQIGSLYTTLIAAPTAAKLDTMDIWGNVRIPFMDQNATDDWHDLPSDTSKLHYSSLAGVPLRHPTSANKTFTIESNYIQLECKSIRMHLSKDVAAGGLPSHMDSDALTTTDNYTTYHTAEFPNGTWHGYSPMNRTEAGVSTTWGIAVDRVVGSYWNISSSGQRLPDRFDPTLFRSPSMFLNETGIEVSPANLLLQVRFPPRARTPEYLTEFICGMSQRYVESRVRCSHTTSMASGKHNCSVISQRPSQKKHAPESISYLSLPHTFNHVSREMPLATGRDMGEWSDLSLYYLKDPLPENMTSRFEFQRLPGMQDIYQSMPEVKEGEIELQTLGVRLSQLLNTYLTLSQLSLQIMYSDSGANVGLRNNITASADVSKFVEVFDVSEAWIGLCFLSCIVLLVGGILSVVFTHLSHSPEILGYISTIVRDSKYVVIPPDTRWLDGLDLTKGMITRRIRFGFMNEVAEDGEPIVGVGYQDETGRIKDFSGFK